MGSKGKASEAAISASAHSRGPSMARCEGGLLPAPSWLGCGDRIRPSLFVKRIKSGAHDRLLAEEEQKVNG